MPIVKETSARLVKRNITHDAISREVVQSITNPVALAIYTYLLTKPDNWVVRKREILDHFDGLGRERYEDAMRFLKSAGLVWIANIRSPNGSFGDNQIVVEQTPLDRSVGKPAFRENPNFGKSGPLKKKRIPTEEEIGIRGWDDWVQYRKELKKPMTESTVKKQAKQLTNHPPEIQKAMIDQSIEKGWTGLFEIKEKSNGHNRGNTRTNRKGPEVRRAADLIHSGHVIDG
jgi:hypothetical protein